MLGAVFCIQSWPTWHPAIFELDQEQMCGLDLLRFSCSSKSFLAGSGPYGNRAEEGAPSPSQLILPVEFADLLAVGAGCCGGGGL